MSGFFISFEGGEGAGKTVQITRLAERLEDEGYDIIITREPGGLKSAERIRNVLLSPDVTDMDVKTEVALYAASRRENFIHIIKPALDKGKVVLTDRFVDSSLVYQGIVKKAGIDNVRLINESMIDRRFPDLTLFFDLDPAIGLKRINSNDDREKNRFDKLSLDFHQQVREGYQFIQTIWPERIKEVNAALPIHDVEKDIWRLTNAKLNEIKKIPN